MSQTLDGVVMRWKPFVLRTAISGSTEVPSNNIVDNPKSVSNFYLNQVVRFDCYVLVLKFFLNTVLF